MSEEILKSLVQLFAIISGVDGNNENERNVVSAFLNEQLNLEMTEKYMVLFDEFTAAATASNRIRTQKTDGQPSRVTVRASSKMILICSKINQELTQQQKIALIFALFALIMADGEISAVEYEFLTTVADIFNVDGEEFKNIEHFVRTPTPFEFNNPNILVIHNQLGQAVSGETKQMYIDKMNGQISVLRIPSLEMYVARYDGKAEYFINNHLMRASDYPVLTTGSAIRNVKSDPIYYSDIVSRFFKFEGGPKVTLEARSISYTFPNGRKALHEFNFCEQSGTMVALMGPSGAGKSTLLEILNGIRKPEEGFVTINGIDIHNQPSQVEGLIGYVPQEDLLIEELTVFENLYYAAKLMFGNYTDIQIRELVDTTLNNLGIAQIANFRVGSVLQKIISGGERKRLNIGLELLREPSILFIDEPTSGLASSDSYNIMDLLKELTFKGKVVFVVIHQPSSEIFKMFDKVIVLDTGGFPIYYGNPIEAVSYFRQRVNHVNTDNPVCSECGTINPEEIFEIVEAKVVNEYGRFTHQRKISPFTWYQYFTELFKPPAPVTESHQKIEIKNKRASWLKQLFTYISRDVNAKRNNTQYLAINLTQAPFLALILAFICFYHKPNYTYSFIANENIPIFIFMAIIVSLFLGLTISAEEIFHDRKILKREMFLNLSRSSYLLSKIIVLFSISAIQTSIFLLVGLQILGIEGLTLNYWLVLFSSAAFANLMGLIISSTFNSAVTIYILIPILLIPQLVLGGVVVRFDRINPSLKRENLVPMLSDAIASRWAFEALMVTQFRDNAYMANFYNIERTMSNSKYKTGFLISTLEGKINVTSDNLRSPEPEAKFLAHKNLKIIKHHVEEESRLIPKLAFNHIDKLTPDKFTPEISDSLRFFFKALRRHYNKVNDYANVQKSEIIKYEVATDPNSVVVKKDRYFNEGVEDFVTRSKEADKIMEGDDKMIQLLDPIFLSPNPKGPLDYRAHFYAPVKHIAGHYIDTFNYNLAVIWIMTAMLYVLLYYHNRIGLIYAFFVRLTKQIRTRIRMLQIK